METLNNFGSIYCFISFIIGAMFMFATLCIVAMGKEKESNNVRFFVTRDNHVDFRNPPVLWIGVPKKINAWYSLTEKSKPLAFSKEDFKHYGLNYEEFFNMKEGEIREVFITMKD